MSKPQIIAVVGPTASGKTALAIALAKKLGTEIISADSRQFYKELPIGSAMPSEAELNAIKHHFIACRSITDEYAAGAFAQDARRVIDELLKEKKQVIVCGGSGLYIQSLLFEMDHFPPVTDEAKKQVEDLLQSGGIEALQRVLAENDPAYYQEVDIHNKARLRRALEVYFSSGFPFSSFRTQQQQPVYTFAAVGIEMPKSELHARIHHRVNEMLQAGLENEAKSVYAHKNLKSLQTVGYKEFFDYFDGNNTYQECIELIKTHTRQYAKRQMTWFQKQLPVKWVDAKNSAEEILNRL